MLPGCRAFAGLRRERCVRSLCFCHIFVFECVCRGQFQPPTNSSQPPPPPPPPPSLFNKPSLNQQLPFSITPVRARHARPLAFAISLPSPVVTWLPPPILRSSHDATLPFCRVFAAGRCVSSFFRSGKCRAAAQGQSARLTFTASAVRVRVLFLLQQVPLPHHLPNRKRPTFYP